MPNFSSTLFRSCLLEATYDEPVEHDFKPNVLGYPDCQQVSYICYKVKYWLTMTTFLSLWLITPARHKH